MKPHKELNDVYLKKIYFIIIYYYKWLVVHLGN